MPCSDMMRAASCARAMRNCSARGLLRLLIFFSPGSSVDP
jgi:hypothetical protein